MLQCYDFFFYLVCGPELCVCATRIGVTSRLFPLWEKTDFVPAWLILLTVCTTQSFYRFVILSLRSLHLCCTKPTPPTKHCTRRNRIILIKERVPLILRGNHQKCFSFYLLITPSLQSLCTLFEDIESPSSGKKLYVKVLVQEQKEIKRHHIKRLFPAESWKKNQTHNKMERKRFLNYSITTPFRSHPQTAPQPVFRTDPPLPIF